MLRKLIKNDFSYIKYNNLLLNELSLVKDIRNRVVLIAKFMLDKFPKLPYFWGGGHHDSYNELVGINKNWGRLRRIEDDGCLKQEKGKLYPYSLDCSGFVTWVFINAGYKYNNKVNKDILDTRDILKLGKKYLIKDNFNIIDIGDIAWMAGHVGIIINVWDRYLDIVHVSLSGEGLNMTRIDNNGFIVFDDLGEMKECKIDRIGIKYFTHVIKIRY